MLGAVADLLPGDGAIFLRIASFSIWRCIHNVVNELHLRNLDMIGHAFLPQVLVPAFIGLITNARKKHLLSDIGPYNLGSSREGFTQTRSRVLRTTQGSNRAQVKAVVDRGLGRYRVPTGGRLLCVCVRWCVLVSVLAASTHPLHTL